MGFPVTGSRRGRDTQIGVPEANVLLLTATSSDVSTPVIKSDFSSLSYILFFILNYAKVFGVRRSTAVMPGICLAKCCANKTIAGRN